MQIRVSTPRLLQNCSRHSFVFLALACACPNLHTCCSDAWGVWQASTVCAAVVSAAESIEGVASGNAEVLQTLASGIRSATETLGAYLPWPLADPTVALGADVANVVALQPQWPGVGRLLVRCALLCGCVIPHEQTLLLSMPSPCTCLMLPPYALCRQSTTFYCSGRVHSWVCWTSIYWCRLARLFSPGTRLQT